MGVKRGGFGGLRCGTARQSSFIELINQERDGKSASPSRLSICSDTAKGCSRCTISKHFDPFRRSGFSVPNGTYCWFVFRPTEATSSDATGFVPRIPPWPVTMA